MSGCLSARVEKVQYEILIYTLLSYFNLVIEKTTEWYDEVAVIIQGGCPKQKISAAMEYHLP